MRIKFYKSDDVKKAFKERNLHVLKSWIKFDFTCGPQSVIQYNSSGFPISGRYTGVECNCGKVFHEEK